MLPHNSRIKHANKVKFGTLLRVEVVHRENVVFKNILRTSTSQKVKMAEFIFHVISKM